MAKETKVKSKAVMKKALLRICISNDHFEALQQLEERSGIRVPQLGVAAFVAGLPSIQKRFAIDIETN